jgi:predicted ArsR family transcriptional regulator
MSDEDLFGYGERQRYPNEPVFKAEGTSKIAAEEMSDRAGTLRLRCLALLKEKPLTADECASELGESVLAIRPRLSELRAKGKIEPSGARRRNASGKMAEVWKAMK